MGKGSHYLHFSRKWKKGDVVNFNLPMRVSVEPVSYTHLDVYKRQDAYFLSGKNVDSRFATVEETVDAPAYLSLIHI